MKKFPLYRIIKNTYYEKCEVKSEFYTVEYQKPFFHFWKRWVTLKETVSGWGDDYKTAIRFNNESEAIYAIKNLQMGNLSEGWTENVVSILDFNYENKQTRGIQ